MGKLLEQLENHFKNTPDEVLRKEAEELEELNEITHDLWETDVIEYAKRVRGTLPDSDDNG
jgi:hypothetical protein